VTIAGVWSIDDQKIVVYPSDTAIYAVESIISQTPAYPEFILENGILYNPKNLVVGNVFQFDLGNKILTVIVSDTKCIDVNYTTINITQLGDNYAIVAGNTPKTFAINNGLVTAIDDLMFSIYVLSLRGVDNVTLYISVDSPEFCQSIIDNSLEFESEKRCFAIDHTTVNVTQVHVKTTKNVTYSIIDGNTPYKTFAIDKFGLITVINDLIKPLYILLIQASEGKKISTITLYISVEKPEYCDTPSDLTCFPPIQCVEINSTTKNVMQLMTGSVITSTTLHNFTIDNTGFVFVKGELKHSLYELTVQTVRCKTTLTISVDKPGFCSPPIKKCYNQCNRKCQKLYRKRLNIISNLPMEYNEDCKILCKLICLNSQ
jgi:hypothetical protein